MKTVGKPDAIARWLRAIQNPWWGKQGSSVVLIDLPTNIRSISYSPRWGNFLMLTRMGDSLVAEFGDGVFVGARASKHHTQLFNHDDY